MRDRLIELVKGSLAKHIDKSCLLSENIADDLLANGVIVPPCKVGNTVYIPYLSTVIEKKVCSIVVQKPFCTVYCGGTSLRFFEKDFGKTVFLTREEAEQALKGGVRE